jgi:hypothetical protein
MSSISWGNSIDIQAVSRYANPRALYSAFEHDPENVAPISETIIFQ